MKNFIEYVKKIGKWIINLGTFITAVMVIIVAINNITSWGNQGPFKEILLFLGNQFILIWLIFLTFFLFSILFQINYLIQRFTKGFNEKFKENLDRNWDYEGDWRISEEGLIVTNSDKGILSKLGINWENYTLTFDARIMNECVGVIIRAQDFDNYYMLQIREDKIRPHRRMLLSFSYQDDNIQPTESQTPHKQIIFVSQVIWQSDTNDNMQRDFRSRPISPKVEKWFRCDVIVKGQSVKVKINGSIQYENSSLLHNSTGKIGFRNNGSELAYIRNVKVTLN